MDIIDIIIRLLLAVVVGGLIGYEREFKHRPAGFRTHILVCVGAAVAAMIQIYGVQETIKMIQASPGLEDALKADNGRIGAQVIAGVGFLGAGTIVHEKGSVKGLTTAASIWSVACIGLAAGQGYYSLAILSTACVYFVLVMLKKFEHRFIDKVRTLKIQIVYQDYAASVQKVAYFFKKNQIKMKNIEFSSEEEPDEPTSVLYTVLVPKEIEEDRLISELENDGEKVDVKIV